MTAKATKFCVFGMLMALTACGGGGDIFPDGDVVEPPDFKLIKSDVKTSGGLIQSGTMSYEGEGELTVVYRDYLALMREVGWVRSSGQIDGPKAVGTLRKDTRTCELSFTSSQGMIRISITVSPAK